MNQPLPPLNALRAFEAIARHLSFAKAADELHVTPAALSHQIRALEEQFGPAAVPPPHARDRTDRCRPADLSGPARRLRERARRDGTTRPGRATGNVLVISATPGLVAKWLMPRLWRFLHEHPDIDARVSASLKVADFAAEGVDVAIRLSKENHAELYAERLCNNSVLPVCSPAPRRAGVAHPANLPRFPLIR